MLFLLWKTRDLQGVPPLDPRPGTFPLDPTPQGSRTVRASIFCTLLKRFLINGAPSHLLPTGTPTQSYATDASNISRLESLQPL